MKKIISIFLTLILTCSAVSINCFSITADQASLNQILDTEIFVENKLNSSLSEKEAIYYKALKNELLTELHNRDIKDITAKLSDYSILISDLKNKFELLKLDNGALYSSVKNAAIKIEQTERIQKILEDELYSRSSWITYIAKKVLYSLKEAIVGGIDGALTGTATAIFFSPFFGFNSSTIIKSALKVALINSIISLLSDFSLKYFTKSEEINDLSKKLVSIIPSIAGDYLSSKLINDSSDIKVTSAQKDNALQN